MRTRSLQRDLLQPAGRLWQAIAAALSRRALVALKRLRRQRDPDRVHLCDGQIELLFGLYDASPRTTAELSADLYGDELDIETLLRELAGEELVAGDPLGGWSLTIRGERALFGAEDLIRAKWLFDRAETLSQAADMLRGEARRLEELERVGWQLRDPVSDDYGFLRRYAIPRQALEG